MEMVYLSNKGIVGEMISLTTSDIILWVSLEKASIISSRWLLLGVSLPNLDSGVGKTNLLSRFEKN